MPIYLENYSGKSRVSAGLSCGVLWTISKLIKVGDIILCRYGSGSNYVGVVLDTYSFHHGQTIDL